LNKIVGNCFQDQTAVITTRKTDTEIGF